MASPIGALLKGMLAGALGSWAQNLFFRATARVTPQPPSDAFVPPEPEQAQETATVTVARRLVEGMMQRGPVKEDAKARGGQLVHYAFGAAWGGLYGLTRASAPDPFRGASGMLTFSLAVWGVSDNVLLPAFKLSASPLAYPPRFHVYAIAAHIAYGAAVWGAFESVTRAPALSAALGWGALTREAKRAGRQMGASRARRVRDVMLREKDRVEPKSWALWAERAIESRL